MRRLSVWVSICTFAFYITTALLDPISVVFIGDADDSIAKTALRAGIQSGSKEEFKIEIISVSSMNLSSDLSEMSVCSEIFSEERKPHLVIDVSKETIGPKLKDKKSDIVKSVLRKMGAPTVSLTPTIFPWPGAPLTDAEKEYLVKFIPPDLVISNVVKSVADVIRAQKIGVVYDKSVPFTNKVGLLFDNIPSSVGMVPVGSDMKADVEKIGLSDIGNIFLFGNNPQIALVLEEASKQNFVGKQFAWYTISKEEGDLTPVIDHEFTVMNFKPKAVDSEMEKELSLFASYSKIDSAFYYDLAKILRAYLLENVGKEGSWPADWTYPECTEDIALTEEMVAQRADVKLRTWLETRENSNNLKGTFGDFTLKIPPGSSRTYGHQNIQMEVEELQLSSNGVLKNFTALVWQYKADAKKPSEFFTGPLDVVKKHKGVLTLRVSTVEDPPFMYKHVVNGEVTWTGYLVDLMELLKKEANLTFEYRITENTDYHNNLHGRLKEIENKNITFNSIIGDVYMGKADLALGAIAVMAERELFVDFTVPFYDLMGVSVLMKRFKPDANLFSFMISFDHDVWYAIFVSIIATSLMIYLIDRLSPSSFYNNPARYADDPGQRPFSLNESFWFCFASLTPQGGGEAPATLSGRFVAGTLWVFGFIIMASYGANFAAFLTVSRAVSTIESLEDLSRQYKVKYSIVENSLTYTYIDRMAKIEERFFDMWKNMSLDDTLNETQKSELAVWDFPVTDTFAKIFWICRQNKFYKNLEEAINKTRGSTKAKQYALIAEATQVKYATMKYCDLKEIGKQHAKKPIALALSKGSPYLEQLSAAILKLRNERVLEKLKNKWWNENPYLKKCNHYEKRNDGIEYENIGGIFYVMAFGVILAVFTLIVEFIYFKCKRASDSRVVMVKDYATSARKAGKQPLNE